MPPRGSKLCAYVHQIYPVIWNETQTRRGLVIFLVLLICLFGFFPFSKGPCIRQRHLFLPSFPSSLSPSGNGQRLRWYTSVSQDTHAPQLGAALRSAQVNAFGRLAPTVLIPLEAEATPLLESVAARYNATVIRHNVFFADELKSAMLGSLGMSQEELHIALATFLRLDAALLAASETLFQPIDWVRNNLPRAALEMSERVEEDVLLYTDSDILFLGPAADAILQKVLPTPDIFSVVADGKEFNSGVMVIRVSGMLKIYDLMIQFWIQMSFKCVKNAWDQGCLIAYVVSQVGMMAQVASLPSEFHFTPYSEWRKDQPPILILHLHGPKPSMMLGYLEEHFKEIGSEGGVYTGFLGLNPRGYLKALLLAAAFQDTQVTSLELDSFVPWCKRFPTTVPC